MDFMTLKLGSNRWNSSEGICWKMTCFWFPLTLWISEWGSKRPSVALLQWHLILLTEVTSVFSAKIFPSWSLPPLAILPLRCSALKYQSLACRSMLHFPSCSFSSYTSFTSSLIKLSHTGSVLTRKWGWNRNPSPTPTWFGSDKDTTTLHYANIEA